MLTSFPRRAFDSASAGLSACPPAASFSGVVESVVDSVVDSVVRSAALMFGVFRSATSREFGRALNELTATVTP